MATVKVRKIGSGGERIGAGRPREGKENMVIITFRGSKAQKKKLADLGGGKWARARIDAATVKPK